MNSLRTLRSILFPALVGVTTLAALACTAPPEDTPVPTEPVATPTLAPTQVPTPTTVPSPSPSPEPTAAATSTPVPPGPTATSTLVPATPTATSTPLPTSTPVAPLNIVVGWEIDFPNSISFSMETESEVPVVNAELIFGYPLAHSCTTGHYSSVRLEPDDPNQVDLSWDWEMQKTGSIPPGTEISYSWVVTDEDGNVFSTDSRQLTWEDARFEWDEYNSNNVTFYWFDGDANFGQTLATAVENRLDRMELGVNLEKPIKAFIYPDASTLREAVLFTQAWTGGLAFTTQNILLIAVAADANDAEVNGLVHELAHLLVREVTFSCIGDMPTWLDEGLAEYSEGPITASEQTTLDTAMANGKLITIQSLSSSFPADHSGALLAYTQSKSIVTYLIEAYGWDKMNQLLDTFEQGSTYVGALTSVYGFDLQTLDSAWRAWLATR